MEVPDSKYFILDIVKQMAAMTKEEQKNVRNINQNSFIFIYFHLYLI